YYTGSVEGQKLAAVIQEELIVQLSPAKERSAKANDSYYLLKKAVCPIVIVESGFLSNWNEAGLLVTDEYQEKIAQAIADGVEKFLGGGKN
ncbi:MAG: N-acetylmuramoyl-L-alanine amidase, partial [Lachnospiraceae bacterium]|nr:N-acetylmuramoyl-L-alanine amidase [Lachnospiraceae bacterium]